MRPRSPSYNVAMNGIINTQRPHVLDHCEALEYWAGAIVTNIKHPHTTSGNLRHIHRQSHMPDLECDEACPLGSRLIASMYHSRLLAHRDLVRGICLRRPWPRHGMHAKHVSACMKPIAFIMDCLIYSKLCVSTATPVRRHLG